MMRALPPGPAPIVGPTGIDYEMIRETLVEMGEKFHKLGFPKVLSDIEGSGAIGEAVADSRDPKNRKLITVFMRDIARDLVREQQALKRHATVTEGRTMFPNPKLANAYVAVLQAKKVLDETWAQVRQAVDM